jgi:pilus assembly protein CpaF
MTHHKAQTIIQDTLGAMGEEDVELILKKSILRNISPEEGETNGLFNHLFEELEGFGPLKGLIEDSEISEILVNGFQHIFYEKEGRLHRFEETFTSEITFKRLIQRILIRMERTADARHPLVDGVLDDGTRIHIALPPVADVPSLSIRRHTYKHRGLTDLVQAGMITSTIEEKFKGWVKDKRNLMICGPTGSGKTTLLRALLNTIPTQERIITLEDTAEIGKFGSHVVNLITRQDPEGLAPHISLQTLLRNSLRMRPDRIVVGEVRGEEALVLLDALATGHRGSLSTLHGATAAQALRRLESLVSRAAPHWPLTTIRQLISDAIDIIIVIEKENGLRKVSQAAQISGFESFGFLLNPLI